MKVGKRVTVDQRLYLRKVTRFDPGGGTLGGRLKGGDEREVINPLFLGKNLENRFDGHAFTVQIFRGGH